MSVRLTRFYWKLLCILTLSLIFGGKQLYAQEPAALESMHEAIIYNGDTLEYKVLGALYLYAHMTNDQRKARAEYNRLRNAVYVTYPYARKAGAVMNDINLHLVGMNSKSDRKRYIQSREKDLKREFTTPLTNLSVYQGKILMKLINRETGNNCYEIIKEYKGGLTARFYQTVAFFFNSNLKQPYDARNDDLVIERLVQEVQKMYGISDISRQNSL